VDVVSGGGMLQTQRLVLRQPCADDIDAYAAMCADAEVMRYPSPSGEPPSRADAWRQLAIFVYRLESWA